MFSGLLFKSFFFKSLPKGEQLINKSVEKRSFSSIFFLTLVFLSQFILVFEDIIVKLALLYTFLNVLYIASPVPPNPNSVIFLLFKFFTESNAP